MTAPRAAAGAAALCFVVPPLDGPLTGGTLFNCELLGALRELTPFCVVERSAPELASALRAATSVWVDSLYLADLGELKQQTRGRLGLLLHYLPSFVAFGRAALPSELSLHEREALQIADAFLVTSAFMGDALEALVVPTKKPIFVIEPGCHAALAGAPREAHGELRVVMVGNVVEGKGFEPWLRALGAVLVANDRLRVTIVGSLAAEPVYADRCLRLVRETPLLAERVAFLGALTQAEVLAELARSDVFVSASRMESYGMALNEARVVGLPVLARSSGNASFLVFSSAGGELAANDAELARACIALARDRALHRARSAAARSLAPRARSWSAAAAEFSAQLAR